jgi:hypothetical protein
MQLFSKVLTVYKNVVKYVLKHSNAAKDGNRTRTQIKNIRVSLEILKRLSLLAKEHRLSVRPQDFYVSELMDYEDIARDYMRHRFQREKQVNEVFYLLI